MPVENKGGRTKKKGNTPAQLRLIEKGPSGGLGYKRICEKYPSTCESVKAAATKLKKDGSAERIKGSGRRAT